MTKKKKYFLFLVIGIVVSQIIFFGFISSSLWKKFQTGSPETNHQLIIEIKEKAEEFILTNYGLQKNEFEIADVSYRSQFLDYSANRWRYFVKIKLIDARINNFEITFDGEKEVDHSNYLTNMSYSYVDEYMKTLQPMEEYLTSLGFYTRAILDNESDYFIDMRLNNDALWGDIIQKVKKKEVIVFDEMLVSYPKDVDLYIDLYMKEELPYSVQEIETKLKNNFILIDQNYHLRVTKVGIDEEGSMSTIGGYGNYHTFYLD